MLCKVTHLQVLEIKTWISFHAQSLQSCPTLCDPMDCGPPGSSVHGILRSKILEWSGLPFPYPGDLPDLGIKLTSLHWLVDSLPLNYQRSPIVLIDVIKLAQPHITKKWYSQDSNSGITYSKVHAVSRFPLCLFSFAKFTFFISWPLCVPKP